MEIIGDGGIQFSGQEPISQMIHWFYEFLYAN